jgi:hypothetical protein
MLALAMAAWADDIVTMPTANQLKAREVDVAAYYLDLKMPAGAPQFVQYQTLYLGLTDRIELDFHRADVNRDAKSVVTVLSVKLASEGPQTPDFVVGLRNVLGEKTTLNPDLRDKTGRRSVFATAAKTYFLKEGVQGPPLARVHLGVGTADWTLLNEKRHEGPFGGVQFLIVPTVGAVVQWDGRDWITGLTIMPQQSGLTIKGGTYGDHRWYGVAFRKQF